jgi:hypothetical protein
MSESNVTRLRFDGLDGVAIDPVSSMDRLSVFRRATGVGRVAFMGGRIDILTMSLEICRSGETSRLVISAQTVKA